jgi:hypothetical protein
MVSVTPRRVAPRCGIEVAARALLFLAVAALALGCGGPPEPKAGRSPTVSGDDPAIAESLAKTKQLEAASRAAEAKALGKRAIND